MKKVKLPPPLLVPPPISNVQSWIVLGLDPSLSRTGYAFLGVNHDEKKPGEADWLDIGSVKPSDSSEPIWVRSKAIALFVKKSLDSIGSFYEMMADLNDQKLGLILSFEYPTPMNDYLVALNRIIHLVLLDKGLMKNFAEVRILQTNASTLRSLMKLTKTGNNKDENKRRAYDFCDEKKYPSLDSDSCDAVLLAMMGRYVASICMGKPEEVPDAFKEKLCNAEKEVKGKGRNEKIITKGLLHRKEYWYGYTPTDYTMQTKSASELKKTLSRSVFNL